MLGREATNINFIVFGLTQPGFEHMVYYTWGEHINHSTTDTVSFTRSNILDYNTQVLCCKIFIDKPEAL